MVNLMLILIKSSIRICAALAVIWIFTGRGNISETLAGFNEIIIKITDYLLA